MKPGSILVALNFQEGNVPHTIQLLPPGPRIIGQDGREWTVPDAQRLVDATNAQQRPLPIDENHAVDIKGPKGEPSPAVGWIDRVTLSEDGSIWGSVSWNNHGHWLVEGMSYRFISPVFRSNRKTGEILVIVGAALTNRANLDVAALNAETPESQEEPMKLVLTALGLEGSATEQDAVTAINALKHASTPLPGSGEVDLSLYAPRADLKLMEERAINAETSLKVMKEANLKDRAVTAVNKAIEARRIAPASKDAYLAMCSSEEGLAQFGEIVKTSPEIVTDETEVPGGDPPDTETAMNAEEKEVARQLGISDET